MASYNTGVNAFLGFKTLAREYIPMHPIFPISDETLAHFTSFQGQFVAPDSVKQYIYGVKAWQQWNGHKFPPLKERHILFEAIQGLKRFFGVPPEHTMEVTPQMITDMEQKVDWSNPNDVTILTAMLLCYNCTLRKDNVTVGKIDAFNPRNNITNADIALDSNTLRGMVTIRKSKTNNYHDRTHTQYHLWDTEAGAAWWQQ